MAGVGTTWTPTASPMSRFYRLFGTTNNPHSVREFSTDGIELHSAGSFDSSFRFGRGLALSRDQTILWDYEPKNGSGTDYLAARRLDLSVDFGDRTEITGPRITEHSPAGVHSPRVSHLDVSFSEPIDAETFTADEVALSGPHSGEWAAQMLQARGIQGVRVLVGLVSLAGKHRAEQIEAGCELAFSHRAFHLKDLRALIGEPSGGKQVRFLERHPLIRDMAAYGKIVSFRPENGEFIALGDAGGGAQKEEPDQEPGSSAARPPDSALGSLSSVALSSGPADETLSPPQGEVNSQEGEES